MNKKNLIIVLVIDLLIIAGTIYLLQSRYLEYRRSRGGIPKPPAAQKVIKKNPVEKITQPEESVKDPTIMRNIKFQYVSSKANLVSIIGDFNDWTPQQLTKKQKNIWEISLAIEPGIYKYNYIVDGKVIRDPYNSKPPVKTSRGFESSVLELKPLPPKQ